MICLYRGRLAPSPTGYLHLGHVATFQLAAQRCREHGGVLVMRMEDLDVARCRTEYAQAALADLQAQGLRWQEGPDLGGPHAPYIQSERTMLYLDIWRQLKEAGFIYPCQRSRKDVEAAAQAPHEGDGEPIFPQEWRPSVAAVFEQASPAGSNWRFRVPDGEVISFVDARCGAYAATAGVDFGDFIVWRRDGIPAYELAVVVDDHHMEITEVVRGEDLLLSTCRQLLIYRALGWTPPCFFHAPLLRDADGRRLAKRHAALSLRQILKRGL